MKEYGVKLNLNTSDFRKKLEDAKEKIVSFTKKAKEDLVAGYNVDYGFGDIDDTYDNLKKQLENYKNLQKRLFDSEDKEAYNQIINKIKETEEAMQKLENTADRMNEPFKNATNFFWNLGRRIRETKDKGLVQFVEEEEEAVEQTEELNKKSKVSINIFQNFERGIKKGVNSIKRFTLSILGIQSIYSMLSRATHAYMAQDDALHNRMQANWIALGAMMEPLITRLINLFSKLVGYVNIFVKTFTGGKVDLISKAMTAVQNKTNKTKSAVQSLNKELATFDEITNINFDKGGGLGDSDVPSIEDYLKELQDMQLNPKVVEIIENLAKKLKDVWDWIEKNKDAIWAFGVAFGTVIAGLKLGEVIKNMTTLFGIVGEASVGGGAFALWGLVVAGIVADLMLAWELGNKIADAQEADEENQKQQIRLGDSRIDTMQIIYDQIDEINRLLDQGITTDEYGNDLEAKKRDLINQAKENYKGFGEEMQDGKRYTEDQVKEMNKLKGKIEEITGRKWKSVITIEFSPSWKRGWLYDFGNEFANGLEALLKGDFGRAFGFKGFAKGNVAYGPTIAEFGEYAGASTNPEITAPQSIMKETMFEALSEALPLINTSSNQDNREIVLNVNGREFARATYGDYQTEAKRVGTSNVAIRRG